MQPLHAVPELGRTTRPQLNIAEVIHSGSRPSLENALGRKLVLDLKGQIDGGELTLR
jgi:hypothetical protein